MTGRNEEFEFDKKVTFDKRREEVDKQLKNHPGKIPIIVQKSKYSKLELPETFKYKFLVPPEQLFGAFINEVRKRLSLEPEKSIFIFVGGSIPAAGTTMGDIYQKHKDEDGFLKLIFSDENGFGSI